jgi:voltage-gated potassium channel|tara:strand:- start:1954 stop:2175 length:222 start_codon:yes stop_codon:yes gene_type:complete
VTITTVGYGDFFPVSAGGRVVALILMLGGVGIFGAITANLASLLLKSPDNQNQLIAELVEEVRELRREMRLRY